MSRGTLFQEIQGLFATPADEHGDAHEEEKTEAEQAESDVISLPDLVAPIAPAHTGFTVRAQPVLYWYISTNFPAPVSFSINKVKAPEPVLETELKFPAGRDTFAKGIHRIDLAELGVRLEKDVEYEWFVYIVPDPVERTGDLIASGTIKYIDPPAGLAAALQNTAPRQQIHAYAAHGVWYDAIAELSRLIDQSPANDALRKQRAALNTQVGMPKVAMFEE